MSYHVPNDILGLIIEHVSDRATLAALLRVSWATYALAAPRLYTDISITDTNFTKLLVGLLQGEAGNGKYPTTESDRRKRALLAKTTTLRAHSVPSEWNGTLLGCPVDKATFPALRNVFVHTVVPQHSTVTTPRRSSRRRARV